MGEGEEGNGALSAARRTPADALGAGLHSAPPPWGVQRCFVRLHLQSCRVFQAPKILRRKSQPRTERGERVGSDLDVSRVIRMPHVKGPVCFNQSLCS